MKRIIFMIKILLIFTAYIFVYGCAYKDFKKAQKYEENSEYLKAAQHYKKVVLSSYTNKKAYLGLSDSLYGNAVKKSVFDIYQEKDWQNALNALEISIEIEDENKEKRKENYFNACKALAAISLKEGKIERADNYLSKAIEIKKNDPELFFNLGYLNGERSNTESEIENYKKCLELNGKFYEANVNLGIIYKKIKMYDESEKYFKAALGVDTQNYIPELGLSDLYLIKGNFIEAENFLKAIVPENIKDNNLKSDYYNKLGSARLSQKRYDEALEDFKQSIKYNFWNFRTRINAGILYFQKSDFKNALSEFNSALELDNNNSDIYNYIGLCFVNLKNYDKAIAHFNKALTFNSNSKDAYKNLSYVYEVVLQDNKLADYYKLKYESLK